MSMSASHRGAGGAAGGAGGAAGDWMRSSQSTQSVP